MGVAVSESEWYNKRTSYTNHIAMKNETYNMTHLSNDDEITVGYGWVPRRCLCSYSSTADGMKKVSVRCECVRLSEIEDPRG